ncbi:hypothetical protein A4G19_15465 [Pasteurellaceae bacterium Macca]|nr:hypothetical protein [Pasteurellaceae bacterium Macca]
MADENNKIDWGNFNETEQEAIAIHYDNVANGTNNPTFPYSAAVFEELAENLASIAIIKPNSALRMVAELQAINDVLLKQMPIPPTKDEAELATMFTNEEIQQNLFDCTASFFLVKQLANIINQILFALGVETTVTGGENGTKH